MSGRKIIFGPMTKKQAAMLAQNKPKKSKKKPKQRKRSSPVMASAFGGHIMGPGKRVGVAAAYATGQTTRNPRVSRSGVDSTRIIHRELIGSVVGTVLYTVGNSFSINPGLFATFPWLSTQALGWEKYRFNSLRLCYYTRTGSNTPGSVILTPDYDAADVAPVNEQIASAYHGTQEDVAWKDNCMVFDQKILGQERFIRTGGLAANLDIKTYDIANTYVGTLDGTAVNWGKLWIEYDITLINQQLNSSGPSGTGTIAGAGGSLAAATPYGAAPLTLGSYNIIAPATNKVTLSGLNIGSEYSFSAAISGTVITVFNISTFIGGTQVNQLNGINGAATQASAIATFTAQSNTVTFVLNVTATTVTFSLGVNAALVPTPSF